ncbi:MAG: translation elongation factor Ts [Alphaproteobacteria bacterium]|nr:translation elongation factor Ts [Alphaproteobacteria bacterium]
MGEVTSALVKELREKSGAGMMDCKKALVESGGNLEAAVDWLRKKGLAAAAKKSGRAASEGLIGVRADGQSGALVEVNAETDFVARNETFQTFVATVTGLALAGGGDFDSLSATPYPGSERTVVEEAIHLVATIGENIGLRRSAGLSVSEGVVASYVHAQAAPGLGRIGVLVGLESSGDKDGLMSLGKQLAMHVAAAQPQFLGVSDVDAGSLDRERAILTEQAKASGKPDEIIEKMVEGRLRKYYEEVVLEEQVFVIDNETKVAKIVAAAAKDVGAPVNLSGFVRYGLGDGIEKKEDDFTAEVARLAG